MEILENSIAIFVQHLINQQNKSNIYEVREKISFCSVSFGMRMGLLLAFSGFPSYDVCNFADKSNFSKIENFAILLFSACIRNCFCLIFYLECRSCVG